MSLGKVGACKKVTLPVQMPTIVSLSYSPPQDPLSWCIWGMRKRAKKVGGGWILTLDRLSRIELST